MSHNVDLHRKAMKSLVVTMAKFRLSTKMMPETRCPFDLLVGGKARIELKVAEVPKGHKGTDAKSWLFNLHRHGVLHPGACDFFVLYIPALEALGFKAGIRLVVPAAEIDSKTCVNISARALLMKWGIHANRWDRIVDFCANGAVRS